MSPSVSESFTDLGRLWSDLGPIKSESGFSFAIASQPFPFISLGQFLCNTLSENLPKVHAQQGDSRHSFFIRMNSLNWIYKWHETWSWVFLPMPRETPLSEPELDCILPAAPPRTYNHMLKVRRYFRAAQNFFRKNNRQSGRIPTQE